MIPRTPFVTGRATDCSFPRGRHSIGRSVAGRASLEAFHAYHTRAPAGSWSGLPAHSGGRHSRRGCRPPGAAARGGRLLVGINLLREGRLDLPGCRLCHSRCRQGGVCPLEPSLIEIIGRAARDVDGGGRHGFASASHQSEVRKHEASRSCDSSMPHSPVESIHEAKGKLREPV